MNDLQQPVRVGSCWLGVRPAASKDKSMAVRNRDHALSGHRDVRPCPLPGTPGLAAVATPAPTVPAIMAALGERGTNAAAVTTARFGKGGAERGRAVKAAQLVRLRR
jgi:hypothetical protein